VGRALVRAVLDRSTSRSVTARSATTAQGRYARSCASTT